METSFKEIEAGKKKVKILLEFPCKNSPADTERFVHMLQEIYFCQMQSEALEQGGTARV